MNTTQDQESLAVRRANLAFRKETQAREGAEAWKIYNAEAEATRTLTAKLRTARLLREATARATAPAPKPAKKPAKKPALRGVTRAA
jgi:hypothetical protein